MPSMWLIIQQTINRILNLPGYNPEDMVKKALKRRGPKLILPQISNAELAQALFQEQRAYIRKRLLALQALMSGRSSVDTARRVRASPGSVRRWLNSARHSGLQELTGSIPSGNRRRVPMHPRAAAKARSAIHTQLKNCHDPEQRKRLLAVDAVLGGSAETQVAHEACVRPRTVRKWLLKLEDEGVASLLGTPPVSRAPTVVVDGEALRLLAAQEKRSRVVKRLLVIAQLAEGASKKAVVAALGVPLGTVRSWLKRFRTGGTVALYDSPPRARGIPLGELNTCRRKISKALGGDCNVETRKRLVAVDRILAGETTAIVAHAAGVGPHAINLWLRKMRHAGVHALATPGHEVVVEGITPDQLMEAHTAEVRPWARRRLLAVRDVLLGHSKVSASRRNGASDLSVTTWLAVVKKIGVSGLLVYRYTKMMRKI